MSRPANKLTARAVEVEKRKGLHADGAGLYLRVTPTGSKNWVYRYRSSGKLIDLGLGPIGAIGLKDARMRAAVLRKQRHDGVDPREVRRNVKSRQQREASIPSFGEVADELIEVKRSGWRNSKHAEQWVSTLSATMIGDLRSMRVDKVTTADVLAVLRPIWSTKAETAQRLRGRIERVLDAAKAKGFRTGDNPAAWRGNLEPQLAERRKLTRGHHAAMPFRDVPEFVKHLRTKPGVSARAVEFVILTAARSGEVRGALWSEFDLAEGIWTVPANRMKGGLVHRVPLCERALQILADAATKVVPTGESHAFPGARRGAPLSDMSLSAVLRRAGVTNATVHGFRSSFRDWAGDCSSAAREVAEAALAHQIGNKVEAAYRRGDALQKRRELMQAWAAYIDDADVADVLTFRARA